MSSSNVVVIVRHSFFIPRLFDYPFYPLMLIGRIVHILFQLIRTYTSLCVFRTDYVRITFFFFSFLLLSTPHAHLFLFLLYAKVYFLYYCLNERPLHSFIRKVVNRRTEALINNFFFLQTSLSIFISITTYIDMWSFHLNIKVPMTLFL